ncbi:aminotransferase [Roseomonas marmotae]|uniref:Aminotransferase n=1 Tax=Roseomonas marmotae TaxID=2768161 RepID=A0ABS3K8X2_9PROT|nr:aminotransferase [Roseomonas marmotae]MBO1073913.1 aminotransferase [Roseomonas marmotae]QTI78471.1 aminotransferase [Roseomonas marmotae]
MKPLNALLSATGTTVFTVMSALAVQHGSINLGQGFPDYEGPEDVVKAAADALLDNRNQYPPMTGLPELRQAVAEANRRFYGLEIDPASEVVVTSGATEALTACLMAVLNPGDEVVLFEPLYDTYLPVVRMLGAVPKLVRLTPPKWELPREALSAAFGPKTKAVLLNTPLNPASKVFTAAELAFIAELLQRHDAYAICDEVYEHLTFDGWKHIPLMTLPGMRARCMRVGSAGKTFSLTGWKVGYVTCDASLAPNVAKAHQLLTFTTPPNLQRAVAVGLRKDDSYFETLSAELQAKRDRLATGLEKLGFGVLPAQGSYFITADFSPLGFSGDDVAFCRHITEAAKVTAIPVSAFYDNSADAPKHYARFAFCKNDAVLDEALARLAVWKAGRAPSAVAV